MTAKISCIIPVCDRMEFLPDAIQSALNQSVRPHEIIVVNNGRAAATLGDDLREQVEIFNFLPYAGVAQALNFGSSLATGDFLAFLEDDDFWNEDYLRNVLDAVRSGPECVVSRIDKMVGHEISDYKNSDGKLSIANLLTHNPGVTITNTVVSKKLHFAIGGFDPKLLTSADRSFIIEILRSGASVMTLPENSAIGRFHTSARLGKHYGSLYESNYQFTRKYSHMMTFGQKLLNRRKILHYRYKHFISRILNTNPYMKSR